MSAYIDKHPDVFIPEPVPINQFYREFSSLNESHINSVDISKPIIIAEIAPGRYNLIDGNHRVEKARRLGVDILPGYMLHVENHLQFLISKEAYVSYVEYWNGKVKEL